MSDVSDALTNAFKKITESIENIVTLNVETIVVAEGADDVTVLTKIDLLQGDISTNLPADYFSEDNALLREFHTDKEKQAQAIIDKNLDQLVAAAKSLAEAIRA